MSYVTKSINVIQKNNFVPICVQHVINNDTDNVIDVITDVVNVIKIVMCNKKDNI